MPWSNRTPETSQGESTWNATDLRRYLLATAHNTNLADHCYRQHQFPRRIMLTQGWHETFEKMRQATAHDGHERWGLVGVSESRERVVISQSFVCAATDPLRIDAMDVEWARESAAWQGYPHHVADVHTHPDTRGRILRRLGLGLQDENSFSPLDLYHLVGYRTALAMMFLLGPTENLVVCRSRESQVSGFPDRRQFEDYWVGRSLTLEGLNRAVAKQHKLVFYRGRPNAPLARIFA